MREFYEMLPEVSVLRKFVKSVLSKCNKWVKKSAFGVGKLQYVQEDHKLTFRNISRFTSKFHFKMEQGNDAKAPNLVEKESTENSGGEVNEGKVTIRYEGKHGIFYNPIQEFNRDISILAINTFINSEGAKDVKIAEAMAASGIRSIRYAKEIDNVSAVVANDFSKTACESIKLNSKLNNVENIVTASCNDACALLHSQKNAFYVIDLDPYGTPTPFLDSAVQAVENGGILLITATDTAVLAGNHADACYSKYGSLPIKSKACHEFALRIVIHTVQTLCNRYGKTAVPLLSLKIDFYVRLFFKIIKSAEKAKDTASQTSMVYQCLGCHTINFQPLASRRQISETHFSHGYAQGPVVNQNCEMCSSKSHFGGPFWTGPIHDKLFISKMLDSLQSPYSYLNTAPRIEGLLHLVEEEVDTPIMYDLQQLCSVIKCTTIPMLRLRSVFLELGYEISLSHTGPNTLKTNAPNKVIWDILHSWHTHKKDKDPPSGTPGHNILSKDVETLGINFDKIRLDANPTSRQKGILRYQMNPTKYWGPGSRSSFHNKEQGTKIDKRAKNQGKKRQEKLQTREEGIKKYEEQKRKAQTETNPELNENIDEAVKQPDPKMPKLVKEGE